MNKITFVLILICLILQSSCEADKTSFRSHNLIISNIENKQSSSDINLTNQIEPNVSKIINEDNKSDISNYVGCWGGTRGGLLKLSTDSIENVFDKKRYGYKVLEIRKGEKGTEYLLELKDKPERSYIKKFFLMKILADDHIVYYGYNSYEDYENNRIAGAGEFFKQNCKN